MTLRNSHEHKVHTVVHENIPKGHLMNKLSEIRAAIEN